MTTTAVKQDLVISAYKPKKSFVCEFQQHAGDSKMAWEFVRQHLQNVPIAPNGNHDGKVDMVAERCDYPLSDLLRCGREYYKVQSVSGPRWQPS